MSADHLRKLPGLVYPEVDMPVVYRTDFVAFQPESVDLTPNRKGFAWNALVKRFSIDLTGTHELSTIKAQFGNEAPEPSPLQFAQHPKVEAHRFIDPKLVDGLSIPSLVAYIEQVDDKLKLAQSDRKRNEALDQTIGNNVGFITLKFWDEAAQHFMQTDSLQAEVS